MRIRPDLSKTTAVQLRPEAFPLFRDADYIGCEIETSRQRYDGQMDQWLSGVWFQPNRTAIWGLVYRDDVGNQAEPLSYLMTMRKSCLLRRPSGEITHEVYYAIGSVVTLKKNRGNGYATHLIRLMHYILAPPSRLPPFPTQWGAPPPACSEPRLVSLPYAIGSLITSGVGTRIYEDCTVGSRDQGRKGYDFSDELNTMLRFNLNKSRIPPIPSEGNASANEWTHAWIRKDEVSTYARHVVKAAQQRLETDPTLHGKHTIAITPLDEGALEQTDSFVRIAMGQDRALYPPEQIMGVRFFPANHRTSSTQPPQHQTDWPLCLFLPRLFDRTVGITHLSSPFPPSAVLPLLHLLAGLAKEEKCKRIVAWAVRRDDQGIQEFVRLGAKVWNRTELEDEAPMGACWYGLPVEDEIAQEEEDHVVWSGGELWCFN